MASRAPVGQGPTAGGEAPAATEETALERAEELAQSVLPDQSPKRRTLVVVNPYATTVSSTLKSLVVHALAARYSVEAIETERPDHAIELCREAADQGYEMVVTFGGDGTVNEAANGLLGSDTPLTCLPGGATNVFCRLLGIPLDIVDATEHLLRLADRFHPRRIDLGLVGGRHFLFSSGLGLDASVVERVDRHPRLKARGGEYYYAYSALTSRYMFNPPPMRLEAGGRETEGVTAIVQNADTLTYFKSQPIRVCEGARLDGGTLSIAVLTRATPMDLVTLAPRVVSGRATAVTAHRHVRSFRDLRSARVVATSGEAMPLQVDGDYLGHVEEAIYGIVPRAVAVVA